MIAKKVFIYKDKRHNCFLRQLADSNLKFSHQALVSVQALNTKLLLFPFLLILLYFQSVAQEKKNYIHEVRIIRNGGDGKMQKNQVGDKVIKLIKNNPWNYYTLKIAETHDSSNFFVSLEVPKKKLKKINIINAFNITDLTLAIPMLSGGCGLVIKSDLLLNKLQGTYAGSLCATTNLAILLPYTNHIHNCKKTFNFNITSNAYNFLFFHYLPKSDSVALLELKEIDKHINDSIDAINEILNDSLSHPIIYVSSARKNSLKINPAKALACEFTVSYERLITNRVQVEAEIGLIFSHFLLPDAKANQTKDIPIILSSNGFSASVLCKFRIKDNFYGGPKLLFKHTEFDDKWYITSKYTSKDIATIPNINISRYNNILGLSYCMGFYRSKGRFIIEPYWALGFKAKLSKTVYNYYTFSKHKEDIYYGKPTEERALLPYANGIFLYPYFNLGVKFGVRW